VPASSTSSSRCQADLFHKALSGSGAGDARPAPTTVPPFIEPDVPNPRHLEEAEFREFAVAAAIRGAERNGVRLRAGDVTFDGDGFAPTRVTVRARGEARLRLGGDALPGRASGGGYDGPLAYRQGKPVPHLFSAL
jgi:hypothetical protein